MNQIPSSLPLRPSPRVRPELPDVLPADPLGNGGPELVDALPVDVTPLPMYPVVTPIAPPPKRVTMVARALWLGKQIYLGFEWLFGVVTLMVALAFLAAVPVLGFLALGYLLEAGGRITRSGKLRHGFPGVRKAARVGKIVLGAYLWSLPLTLWLSPYAVAAQLIDPDGPIAFRWKFALVAATVIIVLHVAAAIARGGKFRYFFWPLNVLWLYRQIWRGGYYGRARDAVYDFVVSLRLPYYFWLGLRGFIGAVIWLVIPITLLAIGRRLAPVGLVGAGLLAVVLLYLPFLQVRFAARNRFRALFEVGAIREDFKHAPWCFLLALFITLLFALPLYLLKIELIPREMTWIPSLVFIAFIFPARILAGWAVGVAEHRPRRAHWFFRWTGFLPMPALNLIYIFFLFYTQYTSWNGALSLYEQHPFMLPVPFLGM